MNYEGYRVENSRKPQQVEEVDGHTLTPEAFFSRFVSTRTPVIINGHPSDHGWRASALWDDDYLIQHAGLAKVMVEKRKDPSDTFGRGRKVEMTFGRLVKRLAGGDESLYMTTQQVPVALDGHPSLMTSPLTQLAEDFEPRPSIEGNLVPQQINMWMGNSRSGASSGLHHDFHDNLYILLRGRKQFTLYDPSHAADMYLNGALQAGAAESLAAAEAELERAMEAELDAAFDDDDGVADSDMDAEDEGEGRQQQQQQQQRGGPGGKKKRGTAVAAAVDGGGERAPVSFSKVDVARLTTEEIRIQFPRFPERGAGLEADLVAGQMMYLPAGWFHEVASFGAAEEDDEGEGGGGESDAAPSGSSGDGASPSQSPCTHLALNYWFHPPDNLRRNGFLQPYANAFHPALWASRQRSAGADADADKDADEDVDSEAVMHDAHLPDVETRSPRGGAERGARRRRKGAAVAVQGAVEGGEVGGGQAGGEEGCDVGKEIMESLQRDVSKGAIMAAFANWMRDNKGALQAAGSGGDEDDEDEEGGQEQQGRRKRRRDRRPLGRRHHRPAVCRI
ncbi:MAG: hypothetical protein WDW38_011175 [Sanguina aurantia]